MMNQEISNLITYAKLHLGLDKRDTTYFGNVIAQKLKLKEFALCWTNEEKIEAYTCPDSLIKPLVDFAKDTGVIEEGEEEFFSSDILDLLTKRPSEVEDTFEALHEKDAMSAFEYLYDLGVKNDYVKLSAIQKNICWDAETTKNKIEITINLSKPEKSNKSVALAKTAKTGYPKCMLCKENVGYEGQGRTRKNMRVVPLTLAGEDWFWQFSPYAYFYQHGIAINQKHVPMAITEKTFTKLLDFVDYAPEYFIGSNACLPIVGGSILAHEHFQGGRHDFPMFKANKGEEYQTPVDGVKAYVPDWYNSVILLKGKNKEDVASLANAIYEKWVKYSDESVGIIAKTDANHNTLAPIARKVDGEYEMYLQLRNNRCDEEHPDGIFHAHKEYHNIKSEAIGLIEAMGRFILPGRLEKQLAEVEKYLTGEREEITEDMKIHEAMILSLKEKNGIVGPKKAHTLVKKYVEHVCEQILYNTAVFKKDAQGKAAFAKFLYLCALEK